MRSSHSGGDGQVASAEQHDDGNNAFGTAVLTPRLYQVELLEAARKENVLACLETGAGKTLVATLLIHDVLIANAKAQKKLAVFVVDRVPLVIQQAKYAQSVLGSQVCVGLFYGDMGLDSWGIEKWSQATKDKNALFMTAQVLLDALRHDVLRFETIALLIFDEAHHATKGHPFNCIMQEFYMPAKTEKLPIPRVFGMTASPVKIKAGVQSGQTCIEALTVLQRNLQARVVTVSNAAQEVVNIHVPNADEYVLQYVSTDTGTNNLSSPAVCTRRTDEFEAFISGDMTQSTEVRKTSLDAVIAELGHYAASYYLSWQARNSKGTADPNALSKQFMITNKAVKLLNLLAYERQRWLGIQGIETTFKCIVFVERRAVAICLTWLINQIFEKCDTSELRACAVLGSHSSSNAQCERGMTVSYQTKVIENFRCSRFGVLVSTSVLEEGLDVPSCGLVVMFDAVASSKVYIQSRGRARHARSRYVMMVPSAEPESTSMRRHIRLIRDGADIMKFTVQTINLSRDSDDNAASETQDAQLDVDTASVSREPFLRSNTTRARVSATAAVSMLYNFCSSLPCDKYFLEDGPAGPLYDVKQQSPNNFICTVMLPPAAPVQRGVCAEPQSSKTKAKRLAALDAYTQLYGCGALDEHLFPKDYATRYRNTSCQEDSLTDNLEDSAGSNSKLVKRAKSSVRPCLVRQPKQLTWRTNNPTCDDVISSFLYEITLTVLLPPEAKCSSYVTPNRYAIMTKQCLEASDLTCLQAPTGCKIFDLKPLTPLQLSRQQREIAVRYSQVVRDISLDKPASCQSDDISVEADHNSTAQNSIPFPKDQPVRNSKMSLFEPGFFLVPLSAYSLVDWSAMQSVIAFDRHCWNQGDGPETDLPVPQTLEYSLVQSRHDTAPRVYFTTELSQDLRASSPCDEIIGCGEFSTFADYYQRRHKVEIKDDSQRMLAAFSKKTIGHQPDRKVFYLVPELCRRVPLSPWALLYMTLIPFWQIYLAVQSCRRRLIVSENISFAEYATAMQPRRSFAHCIGKNYERLEFLGDAVLKALVSLAVYSNYPFHHEGLLTSARDEAVCNTSLCERAIYLEIFNILAFNGASVTTKAWPWYLASPHEKYLDLSEKSLADCVESLIGLHYMHGGIELAAESLEKLGIVQGMREYLRRPFFQPPRKRVTNSVDPRIHSSKIAAVENILGYTFRRKAILVEALTHSSYTKSELYCYQRLEFLGDAVLGFMIVDRIFQRHPSLDPSQLTSIREFAVSNVLFGRVVLQLGLHKYLWHQSETLGRDIDLSEKLLREEADGEDVFENSIMPKVLGDLLESLFGAIFVDQDMYMDGLTEYVEKLLGKTLDRFASPEKIAIHPVSLMSQTVQSRYQAGPEFSFAKLPISQENKLSSEQHDQIQCKVSVEGADIATGVGPNRKTAKRSAAVAALALLNSKVPDATSKRLCSDDSRDESEEKSPLSENKEN